MNSPSVSGFSIRSTKGLSHTSHLHSYDSAWKGGDQVFSLLSHLLLSTDIICVYEESQGCTGRGHDTLTGYSLIFPVVFPYRLRIMRRVFYLQHVLFFKVNKQMSNMFLKTSYLFLSLLPLMGKGA